MDKVMASELGSLGINVDQNLTIDYLKTQLEDYADKGDKTVLFKLHNIARHYEGDNAESIKKFAREALVRLGEFEEEKKASDADTKSEDEAEAGS